MERLNNSSQSAETALSRLLPSDEVTLLAPPSQRLSAVEESGLQQLWLETLARYPNQEMQTRTPDMHLREWERMIARYGVTTFRDGLSKVISRSKYFPDPVDVEDACSSLALARRQAEDARNYLAQLNTWQMACRAEMDDPDAFLDVKERIEKRLAAARQEMEARKLAMETGKAAV